MVDSRYGNVQTIHPFPKIVGSAGDAIEKHKYRFNWDSPIIISPHDPETVYVGGNVIFKSNNRGKSWEVISPDLTTNDKVNREVLVEQFIRITLPLNFIVQFYT